MNAQQRARKKINWETVLYFFSAFALPNFFLFNVYLQNRNLVQIKFEHVLVVALILGVTSLIGLLVIKLLTKSYQGSFVILFLWWLLFWFFEDTFEVLPFNTRRFSSIFIFAAFLGIGFLLRKFAEKLYQLRLIFTAIAGVVALLFAFNALPPTTTFLISWLSESRTFTIRRNFNIDETLPSPDIFWLHVDGMVSLEAMEQYFNQPQDQTRIRLQELGFVIYENAEFPTQSTTVAVPGLLSPDFYDSYLHELFTAGRNVLRSERDTIVVNALQRDGISLVNNVAPYHEFFHAFLHAGYRIAMIADLDPEVYVPIDKFYRLGYEAQIEGAQFAVRNDVRQQTLGLDALNLLEILALMTPFPMPIVEEIRRAGLEWVPVLERVKEIDQLTQNTRNTHHERHLYQMLLDTFTIEESKVVFVDIMLAHQSEWYWYAWDANIEVDAYDFNLFPPAFNNAAQVMLTMIETILAYNPDAVIVIQSDHGLHIEGVQTAMLAAGFSESDVIYLHNSVLSAVLIPEAYGGLAQPLSPVNIARELVNRFVGQNYQLRND